MVMLHPTEAGEEFNLLEVVVEVMLSMRVIIKLIILTRLLEQETVNRKFMISLIRTVILCRVKPIREILQPLLILKSVRS